jgi:translation initiation factor IF-2
MVNQALPGDPVEILGFKEVPNVGDLVVQEGSDLVELSISEDRLEIIGKNAKKTIAVVLKADTQGTLEAVKASLAELVGSSVGSSYSLKFLLSSTGDITESDIMLAHSAKGIIIGFNVRLSGSIEDFAKSQKVPVKSYKTIYELIDDAKDLLEGTAESEEKKIKGRAQVLKLFKLPSGDVIAGCKVLAGALKPDIRVAIYDKDPADVTSDDIPLYRGSIKKLKKGKDDTNVVGKDNECGVLLKPPFDNLSKDMFIEAV